MSLEPRTGRKWVIGLVVGLAVLVLVTFLLESPYSRKPVDDYIARVEASGRPTRVREVVGADPPPETNGAADIDAASKWLAAKKGDLPGWPVVGPWRSVESGTWDDGVTDDERRALDAYFADAAPFFERLAAGLTKPRLRTPFGEGAAGDELPDVNVRWRIFQVLGALASCSTKEEVRLDATELLAKLAGRIENNTYLDEYVSSIGIDYAASAVRRGLARDGADAASWRARLDPPLSTTWLSRFPGAVRRERAFQLDYLRTADLSKLSGDTSRSMSAPRTFKQLVKRVHALFSSSGEVESPPVITPRDLVRGLEATERFETVSADSYPRLAAEIDAVVKAAPAGTSKAGTQSWIATAAANLAAADAKSRLARIALAAAEHRAKRGDFPASLDELKWAFPDGVPLDPLVDASFVYEKTATGVRIASSAPPADVDRPELFVWELKR